MKIYSIEGNIGCGKSTLIELLEKNGNKSIHEPIFQWSSFRDRSGTTILEMFYADQKKYAFPFQMMAFITRLQQIKEIECTDEIIFIERSIFTDLEVFAKMLHQQDLIEDIEYSIYLKWFEFFTKDIFIDGYIYLKASDQTCMARIDKRKRPGEYSISLEYLKNIGIYHDNWLLDKPNVLVLDADYQQPEKHLDAIRLFTQ